uniref:Rieske domain-containing protein n=1 Tax=Tetradesmus obliquus TaxID=3088 RepID=A0A383V820_TETOB|eukprot:jgi/Sobl393_1/12010/SZX61311.1
MLVPHSPTTTTCHRRSSALAQQIPHLYSFKYLHKRQPHAVNGRQTPPAVVDNQQQDSWQDSNAADVLQGCTAAPAAEAAPQQQQIKEQFDWFKAWYPVAVLEDLDPALPCQVRLLGMDLAVWWDRTAGQWRAFQDRCPHRLAPLSEGRIDDASGHLYCNYHGWTFEGSGACSGIPQLPQGQAINSRKACVASYPTAAREGLLWVWPDASAAAAAESAAESAWPGLAPELEQRGAAAHSSRHGWYFRDLPTPWLAVKENADNDASHDTVLHHGAGFSNRQYAKPLAMQLQEMTPTGYTVSEASGQFTDTIRFPCGARRDYGVSAGVAYIVPTGVGTTRQYHAFLTPQPAKRTASNSSGRPVVPPRTLKGRLQALLRAVRPVWAWHMFSHLLVDADLAMQRSVDINRSRDDRVYMPAAADAGPAAYMRWLKEYGSGGPPVAKLASPYMGADPAQPRSRQQLLDRFDSHTQQCKACRTAYQRLQVARQVAAVVALLAGGAAVAAAALLASGVVGSSSSSGGVLGRGVAVVLGLWAAGGLAGGLWAAFGRILQSFVFVDYDKHHPSKM